MKRHDDLILSPASGDDCKDLWVWRNNPLIRINFFDTECVGWEEHKKWFNSNIANPNTRIYIAKQGTKKTGVIRFEIKDNCTQVSVNLNPDYLGKGLGAKIIEQGSERFISETKNVKPIIAEIKKNNIASQKAFAKAGFAFIKEDDTRVIYQKIRGK
ncbi:MAG: GNAT family N-acetyltransferase [Candidatus Omnitrophica bacterium]|nr:GNAT family N-acetyltransferase [Candidatus Omnitrophota bacterium]